MRPDAISTRVAGSSKGLLLGVLALAGCGLGDYEQRIDTQREYLKLFEEENQLLGDPLEIPMRKVFNAGILENVVPAMPQPFFLRPPKGFSSDAKDSDAPFQFQNVSLYQYPGPEGYNILATTSMIAVETIGKPPKGAVTVKDFHHQVRGALVDFYQRTYGQSMPWLSQTPKLKKMIRSIPVPGHVPRQVTVETETLGDRPGAKDGSLFHVYFFVNESAQGVLAYQIPAQVNDDPIVVRTLNASLNTYELGQDGTRKRTEYRRQRKV